MPIYLPESTKTSSDALTPRQIVAELDKYVIGQAAAKRAVAIALRNRMRRQKLAPALAEEVAPKNIPMIGPTGGGRPRRRDRTPQPQAAPEAGAGTGRGGRAQEHPDDRPDRRRQDRDCPPARAPGAVAGPAGRGLEVRRGWLRWPRRRVDGARPRRAGRRDGARRADRGSPREGGAERRGSPARHP